jgi:hypothetical protein
MARFEAQVWASGELPYQVEVSAPNIFAAKKQIVRREGVEEHEVNRIFEIHDDNDSSSSGSSGGGSSDGDGTLAAIAILGTIALVMWAWSVLKWVLLLSLICGAAYGIMKVAEMIKD